MSTESVSASVGLVTGAGKGFGLVTARRLAGAGYRVYLTARRSERGRAGAATAGARFLELGLTSDQSVYHAAGCAGRAGGHLDVLVNKAGITGPVRDLHDCTADASPKRSHFHLQLRRLDMQEIRSADHQYRRRRSL